MKKLLVVGSNSNHTYNYIALVRDAFDEVALVTDHARDGVGFPVYEVGFELRSLKNLVSTPGKIAQIVRELKPDIIHIHQANSFAWYTLRAVRKMKIPTVLTAWGSDILLLPKTGSLLRKMVQYNLRHATVFTSDSQYMAEEMRRLLPERKLDILIANFGIDIEPQVFPKESVFYSNRLHKKLYRVDEVIKAFSRFLQAGHTDDWRLVIAGSGDETDALKALTESLGITPKVTFVGWLNKEENAAWYARATCFVSIPESDATAISLLEAMASGCIPVVSDLPANREWVENGINGYIVNDLNSNFLLDALELDSEKAADLNRQIIIEKGTKAVNSRKFKELYARIAP